MRIGQWVAACATAFGAQASAAEVTDMPPELGGQGMLSYAGSSLHGGLEEQGIRVSDRKFLRNDLDVSLAFSPLRGTALTLDLATTPSMNWTFPGSRSMIFDPTTGVGTYLTPDELQSSATGLGAPVATDGTSATATGATGGGSAGTAGFEASGFDGVWLGVAVAPFSQSYAVNEAANWRIDAGFRTGSKKSNLWTYNDSGKRGTATGGTAFRLAGAFSSDLGVGEPYMTVEWIKENKVAVDVNGPDGAAIATGLELHPASDLSVTAGVELAAYDDAAAGNKVAIDLFTGFGYRSWEDVATGVYLPQTLPSTQGIPMTTSEHVSALAGAGVNIHGAKYFRGSLGMTFGYSTPYRLEHLYDVYTTPDSWELGWYVRVGGVGSVPQHEEDAGGVVEQ
jgi:hypothetical protein